MCLAARLYGAMLPRSPRDRDICTTVILTATYKHLRGLPRALGVAEREREAVDEEGKVGSTDVVPDTLVKILVGYSVVKLSVRAK